MADGDSIYAVSIGSEKVDINVAGTLAASVTQEAIRKSCGKCPDPGSGICCCCAESVRGRERTFLTVGYMK